MDIRALSHSIKYASKIVLLGLVAPSLVIGASLVVVATHFSVSTAVCGNILGATLPGYLFVVILAIYAIYWVVVQKHPER